MPKLMPFIQKTDWGQYCLRVKNQFDSAWIFYRAIKKQARIPLLPRWKKTQPGATKNLHFSIFMWMGRAVDRSKWFSRTLIFFQFLKLQNTKGIGRLFPLKRLKTEYNPDWANLVAVQFNDKGPIAMFFNSLGAMQKVDWLQITMWKSSSISKKSKGFPSFCEAVIDYKAKNLSWF